MPHHKSAVKRMRTSARDRAKNTTVKSQVRSVIRKVQESAKGEGAKGALNEAQSVLDNAVRKGVLHSRTADRKKSRLAKLLNRVKKTPSKS